MDNNQILNHLPNRYPFLLIDRVTEFNKGESLTVSYTHLRAHETAYTIAFCG